MVFWFTEIIFLQKVGCVADSQRQLSVLSLQLRCGSKVLSLLRLVYSGVTTGR